MTTEELITEWQYRYDERLGILIDGTREPTPEEKRITREEADAVIAELSDKLLI